MDPRFRGGDAARLPVIPARAGIQKKFLCRAPSSTARPWATGLSAEQPAERLWAATTTGPEW